MRLRIPSSWLLTGICITPVPALSAEPAWWTAKKIECGVSMSYNAWVSAGMPCRSTGRTSGSFEAAGQAGLALGRALREQADREAEQRRVEEAARRAAQEARERAEAERRNAEADRSRERLLSGMRPLGEEQPGRSGFDSPPGQPLPGAPGLRPLGEPPAATPVVGSIPVLLRPLTPEGGRPIVDCAEASQAIPRLTALLEDMRTNPTQRMAVQRATALVRQETREMARLTSEQRDLMSNFAKEEVLGALRSTRSAQTVVAMHIQEHGRSPALSNIAISLAEIENSLQRGERRIPSLEQLGTIPVDAINDVTTSSNLLRNDRLMAAIGSVGDSAADAALKARLGGVAGETAIRAGRFAIAYIALGEERFNAEVTRGYAYDTLEGLKVAERNIQARIDEHRMNLESASRGQAACLADVTAARR